MLQRTEKMTASGNLRFFRYIIPQYDEITLFAVSFTCGLLLVTGAFSIKWDMSVHFSREDDIAALIVVVFFLVGLVLAIYHAFTDRRKTSFEKLLMLFFAVILNGFSGIVAGSYFLDHVSGWLVPHFHA